MSEDTTQPAEDRPPEPAPAPEPAPPTAPPADPGDDTKKDDTSDEQPPGKVPASQLLLGGASATTIGTVWLASAFGPWAAAVPAAVAVAGGAAYADHRWRRRRGEGRSATMRTERRSSGPVSGLGRMTGLGSRPSGSSGGFSGKGGSHGRVGTAAGFRSGPSLSPGRSGSGSGAASPGHRNASGGRGGGSAAGTPRGGATGFRPGGSSGRRAGGGTSPGSGGGSDSRGGLFGPKRSGSTPGGSGGPTSGGTSPKGAGRRFGRKHSTPPGDGGPSPTPRSGLFSGRRSSRPGHGGGRASTPPKGERMDATGGSRWGGARGTTTPPTGRLGRTAAAARRTAGKGARRLGGWADRKTGNRASTAWKAASGESGFRARRRAAKQALADHADHRPVVNGMFAALGALLASLWAWAGRRRDGFYARCDAALDRVDPHTHSPGADTETTHSPEDPADETTSADEAPAPGTSTETPASTTTPTRSTTMAGLPHAQMASEMNAAAARYEPLDAYQVVDESQQWPDTVRDFALSIRAYAQRLEMARFPLSPDSLRRIEDLYEAVSKTIPVAEDIHPGLSRDHETDLARRDAPRGDESKWNV
ncbi:hypothetical protein [Nocardiopsis gilva]|nr:hypothetical protein [Nocardiopsis gilva]